MNTYCDPRSGLPCTHLVAILISPGFELMGLILCEVRSQHVLHFLDLLFNVLHLDLEDICLLYSQGKVPQAFDISEGGGSLAGAGGAGGTGGMARSGGGGRHYEST